MSNNTGRVFLAFCMLLFISSAAIAGGKSDSTSQFDETKKPEANLPAGTEPNISEAMESSVWETAVDGQNIEVNGRLRRVGNEPLSFLVITDSADKDWYIDDNGSILLQSYEQKLVTVRGTVMLKEMVLANGKKLGTRRILTEITIIK